MSSEIRLASTIILIQKNMPFDVLMMKRYKHNGQLSDAMVFPGGKLETQDLDTKWSKVVKNWDSVPTIERGMRIAVIRELFEEVGILLGHNINNQRCSKDDEIARKLITEEKLNFYDFLQQQKIVIDLNILTLFSRWQAPTYVEKRFDTFFYLAPAPENQIAVPDGYEAVDIEWISPHKALELEKINQRKIIFPTRMNLKMLSEAKEFDDAFRNAELRKIEKVEPFVENRGAEKYLILDPKHGYGDVAELMNP